LESEEYAVKGILGPELLISSSCAGDYQQRTILRDKKGTLSPAFPVHDMIPGTGEFYA
jgi:hypothetical protein